MPDPSTPNPYDPPEAPLGVPEPVDVDERALALRRENLGPESTLRALGLMNFIGAGLDVFLIACAGIWTFAQTEIPNRAPAREPSWLVFLFLGLPILVFLHVDIGLGLRRLSAWSARVQWALSAAVIASLLKSWARNWGTTNLPDFAIASILSGLLHYAILYYLLGSKARRVLGRGYREVVAATPHLRGRRGWLASVTIVPLSFAAEWGVLMVMKDLFQFFRWISR